MYNLSWSEVKMRAMEVAKVIEAAVLGDGGERTIPLLYGVPRGGIYAALAIQGCLFDMGMGARITENPKHADFIVDDIIDSGRTKEHYEGLYEKPFLALVNPLDIAEWVSFPWERMNGEQGCEDAVTRIIQYIGDDPNREGLKETPARVLRAYDELFGGYKQDPATILKSFTDGACDEMVVLKGIEFYSTCVVGSTFVETPAGRIPINRLIDGSWVYCWDEDRNQMTLARAFNPRVTGRNKRLWRVFTDKDTILCTKDHRFLTYNRGWVKAHQLRSGDSVIAFNRGCIEVNGKMRPYVNWPGKEKQIPEHRLIYQALNGPIPKGSHIHHLDGNPANNNPENLTSLSISDHSTLHRLVDGPTGFALFTDAQRLAMRQKQIEGVRQSQTEEVRKRRSESVKRYWDSLSPEERTARNHRVLSVERTEWKEDVWCMDVPGYENFVANGMVVHNCEHHMLPFTGVAHVGYVPDGKVVGISKLARLLEVFTRRLQIQERICQQVTKSLMDELNPLGAACVIEAKHLCMTCRGVNKQQSIMVTSSMEGIFREVGAARNEFLQLIHHA